jgi:putative SOS response-associated peptidase YedK
MAGARKSFCVVPFTSFSEFNKAAGGNVLFAFDETRPLAVFAGVWARWTSARKVKEGETTNDLFGFLTTEPNGVVAPIHLKAMPVMVAPFARLFTVQYSYARKFYFFPMI